jgi:hypothetical protein
MTSKRTIVTALLASSLIILLISAGPVLAEDSTSPDTNSEANDETDQTDHDGWRYDTYYIFPCTRHMPDSDLPMAGQIALYPFAFAIDLVQWPFGVLVGLGGE